MAELYQDEGPKKKIYWDKQTYKSLDEQLEAMKVATTLYVGNLSFYTSECQIHELFSTVGQIRRIIMGLDRFKKTPCGFCFVEYESHDQAVSCVNYINGTKLDDRMIRCELDGGFKEGRQFGRGNSGGQVRDDRRPAGDYDPGRGGFGKSSSSSRPFRRPERRRTSSMDSNKEEDVEKKRPRSSSMDSKHEDETTRPRASSMDGSSPEKKIRRSSSMDASSTEPQPQENENDKPLVL